MIKLKGFKFMTTLVLVFKKIESEDKTKYYTFYSNSKAEIIINENDIDVFESIYTTIISNIQKSLGKLFIICAEFESILTLEDNRKQNPESLI